MAAGNLTSAELLGVATCHTPACWDGPTDVNRSQNRSGDAEVWRIGRQTRLVCQRCGGCWGMSQYALAQVGKV